MPRKISAPEKTVINGQHGILDLHNQDLRVLHGEVGVWTGLIWLRIGTSGRLL
jgi:hypothetical protein